jgi:hypothetical protein
VTGIPVENFIHTAPTMLGYLPKALAGATCRASFPSPSSPKGQPECLKTGLFTREATEHRKAVSALLKRSRTMLEEIR